MCCIIDILRTWISLDIVKGHQTAPKQAPISRCMGQILQVQLSMLQQESKQSEFWIQRLLALFPLVPLIYIWLLAGLREVTITARHLPRINFSVQVPLIHDTNVSTWHAVELIPGLRTAIFYRHKGWSGGIRMPVIDKLLKLLNLFGVHDKILFIFHEVNLIFATGPQVAAEPAKKYLAVDRCHCVDRNWIKFLQYFWKVCDAPLETVDKLELEEAIAVKVQSNTWRRYSLEWLTFGWTTINVATEEYLTVGAAIKSGSSKYIPVSH